MTKYNKFLNYSMCTKKIGIIWTYKSLIGNSHFQCFIPTVTYGSGCAIVSSVQNVFCAQPLKRFRFLSLKGVFGRSYY